MRVYRCKMSVRALVESVWIGGDLVSTAPSIERANLGSRIHRMLQSSAQGDYESEVFLKLSSELDDILFEIEGRADGVRKEDDQVTIEEIKTTANSLFRIERARHGPSRTGLLLWPYVSG